MTTIQSGDSLGAAARQEMSVSGGKRAETTLLRFGDSLAQAVLVGDCSSLAPVRKLSDEEVANLHQVLMDQFKVPADPAQADNHPSNTYATVEVAGKVVATIYNSGCTSTSNRTYAQVANLPSMGEGEHLTGPALAQKRAREIAERLGGTVRMAATAASQTAWESRPPVRFTYDYAAMNAALAKSGS
ncbi:hypothetical protein dsx2_0008 [Desulfovibrio sp. X2]|uniref:hypothetical protein n=1 Tax=Desulfovibrio sp. X2 TaxID=941449 RepID=UPI000358E653|nr:hypothetical protein [Desulfovibrio sp. X2]EPR43784.1 hypothetical protein dsx2_0008 [Desulfovibrio sp. X2]